MNYKYILLLYITPWYYIIVLLHSIITNISSYMHNYYIQETKYFT